MKKLLRAAFLATVVAVAVTASADQPPAAIGEGEFGCCCGWTEWAGMCPFEVMQLGWVFDNACVHFDDDGDFVAWCADDPDGVYPFRGMTWPERADFIAQNYGIEPTVGGIVDFFCGLDRTRAPGSE